jgi:hypothetical protein
VTQCSLPSLWLLFLTAGRAYGVARWVVVGQRFVHALMADHEYGLLAVLTFHGVWLISENRTADAKKIPQLAI